MAKKKISKGKKKAGQAAAPLSPERQAAADLLRGVDAALERGSYAGVRAQAAHVDVDLTAEERAQVDARRALIEIDPVQLAIGGFAIICVLVAGTLSLVGG